MSNWRPIEEAPASGIFLVYRPDAFSDDERMFLAERWEDGTLHIHIDGQRISATHWMPLPEPPKEQLR